MIEEIKNKLDSEGVYRDSQFIDEYEVGEDISITKGRFSGSDAIFLSHKSGDRVRLLLKLLSTTVLAEVNKSNISRKEDPNRFRF